MKLRALSLKTNLLKAEKSPSWKLLAATFFGAGLAPKAPGTFGSLAAMGILLLPQHVVLPALLLAITFFSAVSISAISAAEEEWGSDAGAIVIDEAVGMWIVLLHPFAHSSFGGAILAFSLFRLFDIWKPFPIGYLNDRKGAFFVLFDDIIAAIFALFVVELAKRIFF